jgi:hypothetical protein
MNRREFLQVIPALTVAFKGLVLSDNIPETNALTGFPPGTGVEKAMPSGFPITFDWQFPDAATVVMEEARHKMYLPRLVFDQAKK